MVTRAAIVVEGGAMRGIFSVGVLDLLLERGFEPFDLAIGASAGACNLASHVTRQEGRNRRSYFDLMTRSEFIDVRRGVLGRSIVDLDWLWDALAAKDPLDVSAIGASRVEFIVAATSALSGEPVYLRPGPSDMFDALKGSCALPGLYRRRIVVGGVPLVDGGVSDPIPVEEAYRRGARRIFVVRSRPAEYVKTTGWSSWITRALFRADPVVRGAMLRTAERYQRAVAWIHAPPSDCRVVHVAPPRPLATSRTTQDQRALRLDYALGREIAAVAMRTWHDHDGELTRSARAAPVA
ncbi:MAG: patatin-like phospholipase family protein [Polyangiaceae bacterium]